MNVNGKYLKDESGNIFSPIVDTNTIYFNGTNRNLSDEINGLRTIVLFEGGSTADVNNTVYFTRDSSINYISISYNSGYNGAACATGLIKIPPLTDTIYYTASISMSLVVNDTNSDMYHYCAVLHIYSSRILFMKSAFYRVSNDSSTWQVTLSGFNEGNSNMYISKILGYKSVREPAG